MRLDARNANRVLALCVPLAPFSASTSAMPVFRWIGWLAIAVAVIAAGISWLLNENRSALYPTLFGVTIGCLIFLGIASHGLPSLSAYLQIVQLLVFWVLVSDYRQVVGGSRFDVIALASVGLMILANFTISSVVELFENNRAWTSPIFENSNLFGIFFAVLAIYSFMLSRAVSAPWMRLIAYALCMVLMVFIGASGSRTSMLAVAAFFAVYAIGQRLGENRALLWGGAIFTLVMSAMIPLSYPPAVGARINLFPPAKFTTPTNPHNSSACVPTPYSVCPPVEPMPEIDHRAGGPLGLNKSWRSGRDKIWPKVIELSGEAPVWGHGLGSSPGAFLPHPYIGMHAHSGFLLVYYQSGLVGLALYFLLWVLLFRRAINVVDLTSRSISVSVLCAACVLETTEIVLIQTHSGFGFALAILATTEFRRESEHHNRGEA